MFPIIGGSQNCRSQISKKSSISLTISPWLLFFTAKFGWQEKERSCLYIHVLLVDNEGFEYATTLRLK